MRDLVGECGGVGGQDVFRGHECLVLAPQPGVRPVRNEVEPVQEPGVRQVAAPGAEEAQRGGGVGRVVQAEGEHAVRPVVLVVRGDPPGGVVEVVEKDRQMVDQYCWPDVGLAVQADGEISRGTGKVDISAVRRRRTVDGRAGRGVAAEPRRMMSSWGRPPHQP